MNSVNPSRKNVEIKAEALEAGLSEPRAPFFYGCMLIKKILEV